MVDMVGLKWHENEYSTEFLGTINTENFSNAPTILICSFIHKKLLKNELIQIYPETIS